MAVNKSEPIDITLEESSPEKARAGVLVVGAFADGTLSPAARSIDEASKGKLSAVIKRGDLEEQAGASLLLHDVPGIEARVDVEDLNKTSNQQSRTHQQDESDRCLHHH